MNTRDKGKVFVAMSGGVDSAVSAALLKRAGYDVTGVFIKVWQDPNLVECTWKEDRRDAMRVAAALDIPFLTFNFEKEYKKEVVDYMIREYRAGRTPNPDVMCNQQIKFGSFFRKARKMGADYIATGHYARVVERKKKKEKSYELREGVDKNKDQSYFLWGLTQKELARTFFPIGHLQKSEVRALARKFKLPNAEKKDSQGLCFIGKVNMKDFLAHFIKRKTGKVLNEKGEMIGRHAGAVFFTIGERHGFTITKKTSADKPYYVINKDARKNILIVSNQPKRKESLPKTKCRLGNENWIINSPIIGKIYQCRTRYRQEKIKCRLESRGKNYEVIFTSAQTALAPGQSLVLYHGEKCLGGGIIEV